MLTSMAVKLFVFFPQKSAKPLQAPPPTLRSRPTRARAGRRVCELRLPQGLLWEAAVVSRGQGAGCAGARGGSGALAKRAWVLKGECAGYSMAVSCGLHCTFVVGEEGQVLVSGWGEQGQLGLGNTQDRLRMTRLAGDFTVRVVMVSTGWGHSALQLSLIHI